MNERAEGGLQIRIGTIKTTSIMKHIYYDYGLAVLELNRAKCERKVDLVKLGWKFDLIDLEISEVKRSLGQEGGEVIETYTIETKGHTKAILDYDGPRIMRGDYIYKVNGKLDRCLSA